MKIAIVGAGVAGALLARRLAALPGVELLCLERVGPDDHSEAGTGLNVGPNAIKALRLADVFRAKVVDTTIESFIFEITGTTEKIDNFVGLMRQIGLVEVGRTGVAGLIRGKEPA